MAGFDSFPGMPNCHLGGCFKDFFIFTPTYLGEDDEKCDAVHIFLIGLVKNHQLYSSSPHHLGRLASTVDLILLLWNCRAVGRVAFSRSASMSFRRPLDWLPGLPGGLGMGHQRVGWMFE